ncbi:hypothetical protein [Streptomyces sp. NPDC056452]|uniref:hypothetical protein n=1 Tax=Streptomyces sp. NPDC056452 TaxID=3345821 RepID=UPI00368DABE3
MRDPEPLERLTARRADLDEFEEQPAEVRAELGTPAQDGEGRELNAYERVLVEDRRVRREMLRTSAGGSHFGLVVTVFTVALFAAFGGARWALTVGGAVGAWFALVLMLVVLRGRRGWTAVKRAYLLTFGWGSWM